VSGLIRTREEIGRKNSVSAPYVGRILPLAWLAPDIVEAILEGRQPQSLTVERLTQHKFLLDWAEQRRVLPEKRRKLMDAWEAFCAQPK
jgi:site-specific DNA recombinase